VQILKLQNTVNVFAVNIKAFYEMTKSAIIGTKIQMKHNIFKIRCCQFKQ